VPVPISEADRVTLGQTKGRAVPISEADRVTLGQTKGRAVPISEADRVTLGQTKGRAVPISEADRVTLGQTKGRAPSGPARCLSPLPRPTYSGSHSCCDWKKGTGTRPSGGIRGADSSSRAESQSPFSSSCERFERDPR
jgi:hypothetical protein